MSSHAGSTARRAFSFGSALLLTLVASTGVVAQDASTSPMPTPEPTGTATGTELTLGPWHRATIDDAPGGHFVRGVASSELGTIALGNREFDGSAQPVVWTSQDGVDFERATFAKNARKGLPEAAVAGPGGWVVVGRGNPERAYAWTSPDGKHWEAAKVASAKGHVLHDVASTPIGLVAVGCEAEYHCKTGKAWISQDGKSWKVLSKLPIQLPKAITTVGDRIVVSGFSDAFETYLSNAVAASSTDGSKWRLSDLRGAQGSGINDVDSRDGEAFTAGYLLGQRASDDSALLARSTNGREWSAIEPASFHGWSGGSVAASDDLVLVAGQGNFDDFIAPVTYSSADLETWTPGTFAEGLRAEIYHVYDTTFTHDGSRAVLVGAVDYAPGIWWADVAPLGSAVAEPAPVTALGPVAPDRFEAASVPAAPEGSSVRDAISGGPGYIAVGGVTADGVEPQALAWASADGLTWEAAAIADGATGGVIESVAALPSGGFAAVGNDTASAEGLAWYSADGMSWEGVAHESFAASILADVVTTAQGVTAVGSEAYPDGRKGLSWSSTDGLTWTLDDELAFVPLAVGTTGPALSAGGLDGALGKEGGRAVVASTIGEGWTVSQPLGKAESRIVDVAGTADGVVAAGWEQPSGKQPESALFISTDAETWSPLTHKRLRNVIASAVGATADGVLLIGTKKGEPIAFWTRDLAELETVRFPKETELEGLSIDGGGITVDGAMAFAVGSEAGQPAIWYSAIE